MIPLVRPLFPPLSEVERHLKDSRDSGALSNFGPCFDRVVDRLNRLTGKYVLPCNSGTTAIQLALQNTFSRGSRILLPDYTHIGTLQAVVAAGCEPILAPTSRSTWTLSTAFVHCVPKEDYDGFIVVSPFGYSVDFESYDAISEETGKPVIYDLAGAWGMAVDTHNPVCFSLHATKNFSCGEGGLVAFHDYGHWEIARRTSNFDTLPDRSVASQFGGNHKLDELKCAVILAQLDNHKSILEKIGRKRELLTIYQAELDEICIPHDLGKYGAPSLCVLGGLDADKLEAAGARAGITVKRYFPLLSEMPGLTGVRRVGVSSPFFRTCVALPSDVTDAEMDQVLDLVRSH